MDNIKTEKTPKQIARDLAYERLLDISAAFLPDGQCDGMDDKQMSEVIAAYTDILNIACAQNIHPQDFGARTLQLLNKRGKDNV